MLEIKLSNNTTIGPIKMLRELIQVPAGVPEIEIELYEIFDLKELYDKVAIPGVLNTITIMDLTGEEPDTILNGYNKIKGLERTLDTTSAPGFRITLRITKE